MAGGEAAVGTVAAAAGARLPRAGAQLEVLDVGQARVGRRIRGKALEGRQNGPVAGTPRVQVE